MGSTFKGILKCALLFQVFRGGLASIQYYLIQGACFFVTLPYSDKDAFSADYPKEMQDEFFFNMFMFIALGTAIYFLKIFATKVVIFSFATAKKSNAVRVARVMYARAISRRLRLVFAN